MMLFLADVGVKENRKSLLCKKSGGDVEICEMEEPPPRWHGQRKASGVETPELQSRSGENLMAKTHWASPLQSNEGPSRLLALRKRKVNS